MTTSKFLSALLSVAAITLLGLTAMLFLSGCTTPEQQAERDAWNADMARIMEQSRANAAKIKAAGIVGPAVLLPNGGVAPADVVVNALVNDDDAKLRELGWWPRGQPVPQEVLDGGGPTGTTLDRPQTFNNFMVRRAQRVLRRAQLRLMGTDY